MKVILHLATSCDGFIAKKDGDSDWVSPTDSKIFLKRAKSSDAIIIGRKTFEQYKGDLYPIPHIYNIVLTKKKASYKNTICATSPRQALQIAKKLGLKNILVAGGGKTSAAFLKASLIDEIFLNVHPLALGSGISVFEGLQSTKKIKLIGSKLLGQGLVELHYKTI